MLRSRQRTVVKLIHYDGQGFVLLHKRWSKGKLNWWPTSAHDSLQVPIRDLQVLLYNGDPQGSKMAADWRLGEHLLLIGNQGVGKNKVAGSVLKRRGIAP